MLSGGRSKERLLASKLVRNVSSENFILLLLFRGMRLLPVGLDGEFEPNGTPIAAEREYLVFSLNKY